MRQIIIYRSRAVVLVCILLVISANVAVGQAFYLPPSSFGQAELTAPESTSFYENIFQTTPAYEAVLDFPANSSLWQLARPIGRLDILLEHRDGRQLATYCTASLIRADLILTAHHCIPGIDPNFTVLKAELRMDYLARNLQGETFPVTISPLDASADLDFSILRVEGSPGNKYGTVTLSNRAPAAKEQLFLIHHPQGNPKQVTRVRCHIHNSPAAINSSEIRHRCDSQGGSSGGLLFSLQDQAILGMHWGGYDPSLADAERYNVAKRISAIATQSPILASLLAPQPPQQNAATNTNNSATSDAPTTITIAGTQQGNNNQANATRTQPAVSQEPAVSQGARGFLHLDTSPQTAEVYLGARLLGVTPLENYVLASGTHLLRIAKAGYDTREINLTIAPNEVSRGTVPLSPAGQGRLLRPYGEVSNPSIIPNSQIVNASAVETPAANQAATTSNTLLSPTPANAAANVAANVAANASPPAVSSSNTSNPVTNPSTNNSPANPSANSRANPSTNLADTANTAATSTAPPSQTPPSQARQSQPSQTQATTFNEPINPFRLLSPTPSTPSTASNNDAPSAPASSQVPPSVQTQPASNTATSDAWRILAQGSKAAITAPKPRTFLINNQAELFNLWGNAHAGSFPMPDMPQVDFSRFRIMAIFAGEQRLASRLSVTRLVLEPSPVLHVSLDAVVQDGNLAQISSPWIFVELPQDIALQATVTLRPQPTIASNN